MSTLATQCEEWQARNPLRQWRDREGLSRKQAAGLLRVSDKTVSNWETGTRPSLDHQHIIANALSVSRSVFLADWETWERSRPALPGGKRAGNEEA